MRVIKLKPPPEILISHHDGVPQVAYDYRSEGGPIILFYPIGPDPHTTIVTDEFFDTIPSALILSEIEDNPGVGRGPGGS